MSVDPVGGREAETTQGPRTERKPCHHDSTRVDGTLDDCCLRCGTGGYWHDGHRHDRAHPSGKVLFVIGCFRSSGSAAQTNDAARKLGSAERWRRIYAAHGADLQTAPSDALDLEPESRSSGSAAQNQEGLCDAFLGCGDDEWAGTYCKLRKGHDGPHSAHYPAARSPQGEDHER